MNKAIATVFLLIILSVIFGLIYLLVTKGGDASITSGGIWDISAINTDNNTEFSKCNAPSSPSVVDPVTTPVDTVTTPVDPVTTQPPINQTIEYNPPPRAVITFQEPEKCVKDEVIDSSGNIDSSGCSQGCISEDSILENSACPNLDDYIRRSQLQPHTFIRNNPYYVKGIVESSKKNETDKKSGNYPECPKCPTFNNPASEIPSMYNSNTKLEEWIPAVGPDCDM